MPRRHLGANHVLFLQDLALTRNTIRAKVRQIDPSYRAVWKDEFDSPPHRDTVKVLVTKVHEVGRLVLDEWPSLKMLSCAFTGHDGVDLEYCRRKGIHVYYVPDYSAESVSELALGLTLSLLRKLNQADDNVRRGKWDGLGVQPGIELAGKVVGILGTGKIGTRTAHKFGAMGCKVLGWSRTQRGEFKAAGGEYCRRLPDLLRVAHVLVLHLPLNPRTAGIIDEAALKLMKREAVLINVARGGLIDQAALIQFLKAGRIGGAGIDVYDSEPVQRTNPLLKLPNTVLAPHIGFKTKEALERLAETTITNIARFARGHSGNRLWPKR